MFSRRDFIHAGCTVAAATLVPNPVEAWLHHGSAAAAPSGFSQRNVANMEFFQSNNYMFINHVSIGAMGPFGLAFQSPNPAWNQIIDSGGWPNATASGHSFAGTIGIPGADEFSGAYEARWDGDGTFRISLGNTTWTEQNYVVPGSVNFVSGNPDITWANTFSAGQIVVFDTTVSGFTAWTKYYVIATGLTTSKIQVSAAPGGAAKIPSANGASGIRGPYTKAGANGGWTNTRGCNGVDAVVIAVPSGTVGFQQFAWDFFATDNYGLGNPAKNPLFYRSEDKADLLAGKIFRTGFKQPIVDLNPGALRFMNWCGGGHANSPNRMEYRMLPQTGGYSYNAADYLASPAYGDLSGVNQYTLAAVTVGTAGNPKTTPASYLNGEVVTGRQPVANGAVRMGQRFINAISNANPGEMTVNLRHITTPTSLTWSGGTVTVNSPNHGIDVGTVTRLLFAGFTPAGYNGDQVCTVTDVNNFTFPLASNPGATTVLGNYTEGHGYQTGDKIVHILNGANITQGIYRLHHLKTTVTVTAWNKYTIGVDTSGYGAYAPGNNDISCQFLTVDVGARGAFAIMQSDGAQPEGYQAGGFTPANTNGYITFYFDKSSAGESDGTAATFTGSIVSGVLTASSVSGVIAVGQTVGSDLGDVGGNTIITSLGTGTGGAGTYNVSGTTNCASRAMNSFGWKYGAWLFNYGGSASPVPLEVAIALVNEVNAMTIAQGNNKLVNLWWCTPASLVLPSDPDYSSSSDWGIGHTDIALNPSSTYRAAGWAALTAPAKFYLEYANELWNPNLVSAYAKRRQIIRWPGTSPNSVTDGQMFLATLQAKAVKDAFPGNSRLVNILSGWGPGGLHSTGLVCNFELMFGNSTFTTNIASSPGYSYTTDPFVVSGGYGRPIDRHDTMSVATYMDPEGIYTGTTSGGAASAQRVDFNGTANVLLYNASPAVGQKVIFSGSLPTGFTAGPVYFVKSVVGSSSPVTVQFSATNGGAAITPGAGAISGLISYTGQGTFQDDNAMYNGLDNTSGNGGNYTGAANPTQAIANFVASTVTGIGGNQSAYKFCNLSGQGIIPDFAAALLSLGKPIINYEGGADWAETISSGGDLSTWLNGGYQITTTGQQTFLRAVYKSQQWGQAQVDFFNRVAAVPNTGHQSIYFRIGFENNQQRWAYCTPDTYAQVGGVWTEGAGLKGPASYPHEMMGTRNRALSL